MKNGPTPTASELWRVRSRAATKDIWDRLWTLKPGALRTVVDGEGDTWYEIAPDEWLPDPSGYRLEAETLEYVKRHYGLRDT